MYAAKVVKSRESAPIGIPELFLQTGERAGHIINHAQRPYDEWRLPENETKSCPAVLPIGSPKGLFGYGILVVGPDQKSPNRPDYRSFKTFEPIEATKNETGLIRGDDLTLYGRFVSMGDDGLDRQFRYLPQR